MTNFVDKVEALKKLADGIIVTDDHWEILRLARLFNLAVSPEFISELCDKALEAERLQAQIQKMNQAEDRLLATGEALAEKLAEGKSAK